MNVAHALVVGGTGMLRGVSLALAPSGTVTVVARGKDGLESLRREREARGGALHPVALDYRESAALSAALADAVRRFGPVGVAVLWIEDHAPEASDVVARAVANPLDPKNPCRVIDVRGSSCEDPSGSVPGRRGLFDSIPGIEYAAAVLGFVVEPAGSRWLTHEEICAGVLRAVEGRAAKTIVGVTRPWSSRP